MASGAVRKSMFGFAKVKSGARTVNIRQKSFFIITFRIYTVGYDIE